MSESPVHQCCGKRTPSFGKMPATPSSACSLLFRLVAFTWAKSGQEVVEMFSILMIWKPHPVLRTGTHFIVPSVDSVKIRLSTKEIRLSIPTFTEPNLENLPLIFESELRYRILDSLLLRESVRHRDCLCLPSGRDIGNGQVRCARKYWQNPARHASAMP